MIGLLPSVGFWVASVFDSRHGRGNQLAVDLIVSIAEEDVNCHLM